MKYEVSPGDQYGHWTVLEETKRNPKGARKIVCRCACGAVRVVNLPHLTEGNSQSCGLCHYSPKRLMASSRRVLEAIARNPYATLEDIGSEAGLTKQRVSQVAIDLCSRGYLRRRRFELTEDGRALIEAREKEAAE